MMRSTIRKCLALPLLMLFGGGCEGADSGGCTISGINESVAAAICSANPDQIRSAFAAMPADQFEPVARVVLGIWREQFDVGKGLPWPALKSAKVKLAYAPYLAQSIRNRRVMFPLNSIQQFALEIAKGPDGTLEQVQGISLLGISDAYEEVPFLVALIKKTSYPSAAHLESIRALGKICDGSAQAELLAFQGSLKPGDPDLAIVSEAMRTRKDVARAWCPAHE